MMKGCPICNDNGDLAKTASLPRLAVTANCTHPTYFSHHYCYRIQSLRFPPLKLFKSKGKNK
jgi:hypothetical protein